MDTPEVQLSDAQIAQLPESTPTTEDISNTTGLENKEDAENPESTDKPEHTNGDDKTGNAGGKDNTESTEELPGAQHADPPTPAKKNAGLGFLDYLTSPIVEIIVGQGEDKTVLTAHQSLLLVSPFLAESVSKFGESGSRRIELRDENVDAFGCFLQFQYTRDYTSKLTEPAQSDNGADDSGEQLLRHARVHTLADKLGIPELKTLAHTKIHRVQSSPRGELEYARYVYANTSADDTTLRKPVAAFWAKSYALRHGIDEEFKRLCLEAPEFAYDVLVLVLENKEKRGQDKTEKSDRADSESGARPSGRKRHRSGRPVGNNGGFSTIS